MTVCELKQNYWSLMSGVMNAIEVFYVGAGVCYVCDDLCVF